MGPSRRANGRIGRFWLVSLVLHAAVGAALATSVRWAKPPPDPTPTPQPEVAFLPPPTADAEDPADTSPARRATPAAARTRARVPQAPAPKVEPPQRNSGLAGRAGARIPEIAPATVPPGAPAPPAGGAGAARHAAPRASSGPARPAADDGRTAQQASPFLPAPAGRFPDRTPPPPPASALRAPGSPGRALRIDAGVPRRASARGGTATPRGAAAAFAVAPQAGDEGLGLTGAPDVVRAAAALRMDTELIRRHPYWKAVYDKVQPLWHFPRWAEVRRMQGEVHVAFQFDPDTGRVDDFEIVRTSRVAGFKENVIEAIQAAAPFGPVPADAPRARRIVWPFRFVNPIIR